MLAKCLIAPSRIMVVVYLPARPNHWETSESWSKKSSARSEFMLLDKLVLTQI